MNIPIIRDTSCPSKEALAARWVLVITDRLPGEMGPITIGFVGELAEEISASTSTSIELATPLDYTQLFVAQGDPRNPKIACPRLVMPCMGTDIDRLSINRSRVLAVVRFSEFSPALLDEIRACLMNAFASRDHLRKRGGRVQVASVTP
jgi:hypothetical protein